MKEEAPDHTVWRAGFRNVCGPVVRHYGMMNEWNGMNEYFRTGGRMSKTVATFYTNKEAHVNIVIENNECVS
jgi:hypothetical protein